MEPVYASIAVTAKAALRALAWRVEVQRAHVVPRRGPAILVANHASYLDPVLLGYAALERGRYARFLGKHELWAIPGFSWILRSTRQIPVERVAGGGLSYEAALAALREGEVIAIFPEATINPSFVPTVAKKGAARLALASGLPLTPVVVWGGQRVAMKGRPLEVRRRVRFTVRFGAPIPPARGETPEALTRRLLAVLRELVDDVAASNPPTSVEDDPWWQPAHLGGTAPSAAEGAAELQRQAEQRQARLERSRKTGGRAR